MTETILRLSDPENSFPHSVAHVDQDRGSVAIVGLGYVGLPTALALAESRYIIGYDVREERLAEIKAERADLLPADHDRLARCLDLSLLQLTTEPRALAEADTVLICAPTPLDAYMVPDLSALTTACSTVVREARPGQTIILTSTTYVGSTQDMLVVPLQARGLVVGVDVFVAFSPERIDPGNSTHVQESTPRVVGGVTHECVRRAAVELAVTNARLHTVRSPETAELTKLLENTFRAVNIALVNEFATASRDFDLDVMEVIEAAATKPYGFMPFYPGPGVGGHCIPCDPHYLLWQLRSRRTRLPVTEAAMTSIAVRPRQVVDSARRILADRGRSLAMARVLLAGVAYKPGVGDVRESPALGIIRDLLDSGAQVAFVDPRVNELCLDGHSVLAVTEPADWGPDLVVLHTLHPEMDYGWAAAAPAVLDATYRATQLPNRFVM